MEVRWVKTRRRRIFAILKNLRGAFKLFYEKKTVRHIDFKISMYTWKCIPITASCTNSDNSAIGLDHEPES